MAIRSAAVAHANDQADRRRNAHLAFLTFGKMKYLAFRTTQNIAMVQSNLDCILRTPAKSAPFRTWVLNSKTELPGRKTMTLQLNDIAPDFEAETTEGKIRFHDWIGNNWVVLFSHPKDFTPVCTTELGYMAKIKPEFDKRGVKIIGLSVDPLDRHAGWASDIKETQGFAPNYPMIADVDYNVS